ncbi:MAG: heme-degrading protein [Acidobacteriaceae bacterium]|nr:heme-degrading protein [Acidobacteriaceae bacterium]
MHNPSDLITTDLDILALQEKELRFSHFDPDTAWALGLIVRELAVARRYAIVIDIRRFGSPNQSLFYSALRGTTPDNARWVERKSNVVARFHRSSYSLGLKLQHDNITFAEKYSLPDSDYATHGGSVPIHVAGTGIIGALTVSGLPQREDHNLAIEALCLALRADHQTLRLPILQ